MDVRTNRQRDKTLLIVASHNIADEPKCVTTLDYLGTLSVKGPWCKDPETFALWYIVRVMFLLYIWPMMSCK